MPIKIDLDIPEIGAAPRDPPKQGDPWHSSMPFERDIIEEVVDKFKPITLDFEDRLKLESVRMRFYRCTRQLLANGNQYVNYITFSADKPNNSLTIKMVESLEQYRRRPSDAE